MVSWGIESLIINFNILVYKYGNFEHYDASICYRIGWNILSGIQMIRPIWILERFKSGIRINLDFGCTLFGLSL